MSLDVKVYSVWWDSIVQRNNAIILTKILNNEYFLYFTPPPPKYALTVLSNFIGNIEHKKCNTIYWFHSSERKLDSSKLSLSQHRSLSLWISMDPISHWRKPNCKLQWLASQSIASHKGKIIRQSFFTSAWYQNILLFISNGHILVYIQMFL